MLLATSFTRQVAFFLVGLILIAPYAWRTWRRIALQRDLGPPGQESEARESGATVPGAGGSAEPGGEAEFLPSAVERVAAFARDPEAGDRLDIDVPAVVTNRGITVEPAVLEQLLADTARQHHLRVDWSATAGGGRATFRRPPD